MKIAYVTASFPYGAGEAFLDAEIRNIAKNIDQILLIPTKPVGEIRKNWAEGMGARVAMFSRPLITASVLLNFFVFSLSHPSTFFSIFWTLLRNSRSGFIFLKNIFVFPKAVWLAEVLKSEGVDHIHVHWGSTSSTMVLICAKISNIPWSMSCHRWDIYENNLLETKSSCAQFVRFISQRGASDAEKIGVQKSKAVIIPMGVEINSAPLVRSLSRKIPQILCAANLIEVKGHKYLIEAIRLLKDDQVYVRLLLAGAGPLYDELIKLVKNKNLEDRIEFFGQMDHASLLHLYDSNQVDLFVLPSIETAGGNHEGVPVSLMEAMARGVPCISTKTGSIEELIPEAENLTVLHSDAQALAEKIREIVSSPELYRKASIALGNIIFFQWGAASSAKKLVGKIMESGIKTGELNK